MESSDDKTPAEEEPWFPTDKIAAALAKAQGEMSGAKKDAENLFFSSHYATLASVVEVAREPLANHGLSYVQLIHGAVNIDEHDNSMAPDKRVGVETRLMHSSGQTIATPVLWLPLAADKKAVTPQSVGSAITYGRRYSLMAMLGIPAEDDDGNDASGTGTAPRKVAGKKDTKPKAGPGEITDAQRKTIYAISKKLGYTDADRSRLIEQHGAKTSTDLTKAKASAIIDELKQEEETEAKGK